MVNAASSWFVATGLVALSKTVANEPDVFAIWTLFASPVSELRTESCTFVESKSKTLTCKVLPKAVSIAVFRLFKTVEFESPAVGVIEIVCVVPSTVISTEPLLSKLVPVEV